MMCFQYVSTVGMEPESANLCFWCSVVSISAVYRMSNNVHELTFPQDEIAEFLGGILSQSPSSNMDSNDIDVDLKRRRKRKLPREDLVCIHPECLV